MPYKKLMKKKTENLNTFWLASIRFKLPGLIRYIPRLEVLSLFMMRVNMKHGL